MRKFYFIQSLKTTDPDLGNQIHSHISKKSQSEFFDVKNRQDLFDKLDFISSELEKNKELDGIIHFHTHGNEKGIGLYDNENKLEFASWKDLRPKFRNIYLSTSKKPMLSICACKGFNISRLVPRFEPCPYDYVTGSFDPIGFVDSVEGYKTFYDGILNGIDLSDNIKNINTNFPKMNFACFSSDQIFEIAIHAYKNAEMVPDRIKRRRNELETIIIKEFGYVNIQQKILLDFALSEQGTKYYLEKFRTAFYS